MRTVVLHIGYPKTGTSAVQWFLHSNRDDLRRQGVYYPTIGQSEDHAHHGLALGLTTRSSDGSSADERRGLFATLDAEIDGCGCETVVLSSELFLFRLEEVQASPEFRKLLSRYQLRVVVFVRRQDAYLESQYRQFVWDPQTTLADDVEAFLDSDYSQKGGDYHLVLNAWAGFVGKHNIAPVVYEQTLNRGGCIARFCSLVGLDPALLDPASLNVRKNEAIAGVLGTQIMRVVNGYSTLNDEQRLELAQRITAFDRATAHLPIPRRIFTEQQCERIGLTFLDSNKRLADEFVGQPLDGLWFARDTPAVPPAEQVRSATAADG